ncbi:hypothetical protein [Devriesea agamarum]|uniref:hypothetical protein n=1 Tax=Devriesea agamarum TaxID=472569 RepID=UPI00071D7087|nr:hypothetical protein [Devriesea agamarum]
MSESSRLELDTDLAHGGRWTSLRTSHREWLWHRPDQYVQHQRHRQKPGEPFIDAGGGEECFPCLRLPYDHGDVCGRSWDGDAYDATVTSGTLTLRRLIQRDGPDLIVEYTASATEPSHFTHHAHLLLDLSPATQLIPGHYQHIHFWDDPSDAGIDALGGMDQFVRALGNGPSSAVCYSLLGCSRAEIHDGADVLAIEIRTDLPCAMIMWRNLGAWPADAPYRSLGIEPSIGHDVDVPGHAGFDGGNVLVQPEAPVHWSVRLSSWRM